MVGLADFETRFDLWVVFEGWKDLPDEVRDELREWQLGLYVEGERPMVEALLAEAKGGVGGGAAAAHAAFSGGNHAYLLLDEAEAQVMRAEHVYLWPCNCRASMERCSKPSLVCVRFENDRGIGFEISRERAVEVLRRADRAGLMRTGDPLLGAGGEPVTGGAICNCCADCCFPHLAAERLGSQKVWPLTRYVAARDPEACTRCASCTRRCPFGAFTARRGDGAAPAGGRVTDILFDEALCRGCGVCATGCPEGAIAMRPLA